MKYNVVKTEMKNEEAQMWDSSGVGSGDYGQDIGEKTMSLVEMS